MSFDVVATGVILAIAAGWAGRRLWRSARRRSQPVSDGSSACGGGCGGCPIAEEKLVPGDPCARPEHRGSPTAR